MEVFESSTIAIAILTFVLSLVPAGLFIWLWYLRRRERFVPPSFVAIAFSVGMLAVGLAFGLEKMMTDLWEYFWPQTSHYIAGAVLPVSNWGDLVWPAVAALGIVALVEEGIRYLIMRIWLRRSRKIDQVFDGLIVGLAIGLGFATLENTLYFFSLFSVGNFNTLVFVFFLRFLISTLAHLSFGGIMGALVAKGVLGVTEGRKVMWQAFLIPWILHGMFDWLLAVGQAAYAVLLLIPPLILLLVWSRRKDWLVVSRKNGQLLAAQEAPMRKATKAKMEILKNFESPWNKFAPWMTERRAGSVYLSKWRKAVN